MSTDISGASWQQEVELARRRVTAGPGYAVGRAAVAFLFVVVTAVIVLSLELSSGLDRDELSMVLLALATFCVASIPAVLNQGLPKERRHIFITLLGLLFIGAYALPPLLYYVPSPSPTDAPGLSHSWLERSDLINGQLTALFGLLVLLVSYSLPIGPLLARMLPRPRIDWPQPTLLVTGVAMLGFGWGVLVPGALGMIPAQWGSGVIGAVTMGTIYANVILTLAWIRHRSVAALVLLLANILMGALFGLVSGSKTQVLIRPFLTVLTYVLVRGSIPVRWIAAGVVLVALVYPASQLQRDLRSQYPSLAHAFSDPVGMLSAIGAGSRAWNLSEWMEEGIAATSHRFDALGSASVLLRDTPSRVEFQNGRTLSLFFKAWVPRILWPDKPNIFIGQWITDVYGSGPHIRSNTAPSHIGEYYINFGILGVVLGMFIVATVGRIAQETLMRRNPTAPAIVVMTVIVYQLILKFESSVGGMYAGIGFAIIPIYLIHRVVKLTLPTIRNDDPDDSGNPPADPLALSQPRRQSPST